MTHIIPSVCKGAGHKVKTAKYRKVESVFMKKVWQQWAIHLPPVLVKNLCSRIHQNCYRMYNFKWGLVVKICHLMQNLQ